MKFVLASLLILSTQTLQADMTGSQDHPKLPRIAGSEIYAYAFSDYDAGNFIVERGDASGKLQIENPEGVRTRILYITKPGDSPIKAMRNYMTALEDLGQVTERYTCRNTCRAHTFSTTLWSNDSMPPSEGLRKPFYLLAFIHNYGAPHYRYAEVVTEDSKLHVGVYVVTLNEKNPNADFRNRTVVLLEVLEETDFEPTLEFVDAGAMRSAIQETGHIALYGIQFDHDKASLRPDSSTTLDEIVSALGADPKMSLYVVGHSDNVGELEYNQSLAGRRAQSVVNALTSSGIRPDRLTAVGVGPVAPIASNATEEGRKLNRRVELVQR